MNNAKRGRARDRVVQTAAIAALGLALSACGGGAGGGSADAASAMRRPTPVQGSIPTSAGARQGSGATQASAPAQSTSASSGSPASSAGRAPTSSGSGSPASSAGRAPTSSGSGSPASSAGGPPTSSGSGTSTAPSVTSVTISWVPPTENTDGTALTNLSGYDIHYGTASHKYTQTVTVSNPGLARYVMSNLSSGTYYFAVAAVNVSGTESPLSTEVTATVN